MTRTKKILISSFSLPLLLGVVAPAGAKCVFKKSCTRNAFKCFQPKGSCSQDVSSDGPFDTISPLFPIQQFMVAEHQCLLAEVAFDPDPSFGRPLDV